MIVGTDGCGSGSYVGDIHLTAGNVSEGLIANGAILAVNAYPPLASVIGGTYGGNGSTTFALPNLTALAPNNMTYTICANGIFPARAQPQGIDKRTDALGLDVAAAARAGVSTAASVTFKSTPEGAEITLDGKWMVGSTPSTLLLLPGDHDISVQQAGYKKWTRRITLTAGGIVTLDARLEKE